MNLDDPAIETKLTVAEATWWAHQLSQSEKHESRFREMCQKITDWVNAQAHEKKVEEEEMPMSKKQKEIRKTLDDANKGLPPEQDEKQSLPVGVPEEDTYPHSARVRIKALEEKVDELEGLLKNTRIRGVRPDLLKFNGVLSPGTEECLWPIIPGELRAGTITLRNNTDLPFRFILLSHTDPREEAKKELYQVLEEIGDDDGNPLDEGDTIYTLLSQLSVDQLRKLTEVLREG